MIEFFRCLFRLVFFTLAVAIAGAGCSSSSSTSPAQTCNANQTQVTQLYPISGTTGVSTGLRVMVFSGVSTYSIILSRSGNPSNGLNTMPHAVPSPLPSPAATPAPGQTTIFAVSIPQLKAQSKYSAWASELAPCVIPPIGGVEVKVGVFSTR